MYVLGRLCSATLGLVGDTDFSRERRSFSFAMKSKSSLSFFSFSFSLLCSAIRLRESSSGRRHLSSSSSLCLMEELVGAEAIRPATLSASEELLLVGIGSGFEVTYRRLESSEEERTGDADLELDILRTPSGVV